MDWSLLWKAVVIVTAGTLLLRIAGRKSISQMTLAQVVIMIGIGSLLVQPLVGKNVWSTLTVGLALVLTLVAIEFGQLKFDFFEKFVTGQSKILIENGEINVKNMKRLRMTIDQLEMQLRQRNVPYRSDVHFATLEPNGQLGFVLKQVKQPATKGDINTVLAEVRQLKTYIDSKLPQTKVVFIPKGSNQPIPDLSINNQEPNGDNQYSLFDEVKNKGHQEEPPKNLQ